MSFKVVSLLLAAGVLLSLNTLGAANPIQERIFEFPEEVTEDDGNAWEKSGYFEGDIILDEKYLRNGKLLKNGKPARFPTHEIPYEIDSSFDDGQKAAIQAAFEEFRQKSCLYFRRRVPSDEDWIRIQDGKGCSAQVGRVGGKQHVNLKKSKPGTGCFRHGTIVHELLHALGFFHQQSSSDRDDYVKIEWDNIQKGMEFNFKKYGPSSVTSFGVSYDYDSVMHYSTRAFSKNGKPTIVPTKPDVKIGQRKGLSPKDIKKLNVMYSCPAPGGYSIESETDLEQWLEDFE